jgi:tetratricopeptide (TPR) repeat protein/predicted Ser/Thr protein kinase
MADEQQKSADKPPPEATVTATHAADQPLTASPVADTEVGSPMIVPGILPEPELPPGTAVGRYSVVDRIGSGAMGVVYAAYDEGLDRTIALKLLRDPGRRWGGRRLQREAQALARLSHPHVITVHDIGTYREQMFVAMEYVEGHTLREWMAAGPRPWSEVVDVFRRAGEGLAAAHAVGIIHRDFKPDNVLIDERGRVRVGDFGLALIGRDELEESSPSGPSSPYAVLTATGAVLGTPAYMAPEQQSGSRTIDARADQFSFCVALYEALYGHRPFSGNSDLALYHAIEAGAIREPPREREVPTWLHRAAVRGLAFDPAARHASMDALLTELSRDRAAGKRRLLAAVAAGLTVTVVAAGLALGSSLGWFADDQDLCPPAAERLVGVWDAPRKQAVRSAFLASGAPAAQLQYSAAERHLDHYVGRWLAMHADSCRATRVRGEQSAELLYLRSNCLDRRLAELRHLVTLFLRADRDVVTQATDASRMLGSLATCANAAVLSGEVRPADQAKSRELEDGYGAARALMMGGKWKDAIPLFRRLATDAQAAGARALEAAILVDLVYVERLAGDPDRAEDAAYQALAAAEAGRSTETMVKAWIGLMKLHSERSQRFEEVHRIARVARSALERIGSPPLLQASLEQEVGDTYKEQGKLKDARRHLELALALRERSGEPPEESEVATSLSALAMLEGREGNKARSFELHQRARKVLTDALGPEHPDAVRLMLNEGAGLTGQDRLDEALALYQRGLELANRGEGPRSVVAATYHNNIGAIHWHREQHAKALAEFELARSAYVENFEADDPSVITMDVTIGALLGDMKRYDDAIARLQPVPDKLTKRLSADHPDVVDALQAIGRVELAAGRPARALPPLERSAAACDKPDMEAPIRGEGRFLLARALVDAGRDRARAVALARKSRADFVESHDDESVAEVDKWLAKNTRAGRKPR